MNKYQIIAQEPGRTGFETPSWHGDYTSLTTATRDAREFTDRFRDTAHAIEEQYDGTWYSADIDTTGNGTFDTFVYVATA